MHGTQVVFSQRAVHIIITVSGRTEVTGPCYTQPEIWILGFALFFFFIIVGHLHSELEKKQTTWKQWQHGRTYNMHGLDEQFTAIQHIILLHVCQRNTRENA